MAFVGIILFGHLQSSTTWARLGLVAVALSLVTGAGGLLDAMQNAARQRLVVAWHQAAGQWLRVAGAVLCIRWLGPTATSALAGYVGASLVVLCSQFLFFKLKLASIADPAPQGEHTMLMIAEMRRYTHPFVAFAAIAWLQQSSDRWILALFGSGTEVGLYQTLNQVGYYPLLQLSTLITVVVAPIFFLQAGDGTEVGRVHQAQKGVRRLSWWILVGTVFFATLLWFCGGWLFALVVAPQYRSAARFLPLAALAGGLFATGQMLTNGVLLQMNSKALIAPKIGTALLAVGLNFAGARACGLEGVVWAGLVSSGVYALWMYLVVRHKAHAPALTCAHVRSHGDCGVIAS